MADTAFDLFVIGAGSAGVRAARMSAGFGARVAIAEAYRPGGTCVIRGCIPKKLLVYAAHYREDFPTRDDTNFLTHTLAYRGAPGRPTLRYKPVTITRFQPKPRTY